MAGKKWKLKFTANVKGNKGGKGVKKNREPLLPGQGHPSQGQSGRFTLICLYNNTPQPPVNRVHCNWALDTTWVKARRKMVI